MFQSSFFSLSLIVLNTDHNPAPLQFPAASGGDGGFSR